MQLKFCACQLLASLTVHLGGVQLIGEDDDFIFGSRAGVTGVAGPALVRLVGVLQIHSVEVAIRANNSVLVQRSCVLHDDVLTLRNAGNGFQISEGHGKRLSINCFGPAGNFSLIGASLVRSHIDLDAILIQGQASRQRIVENILISIIPAHIGHGTNQFKRNCVTHVVVCHIIVAVAIAAVLIVLVVFLNLLFHGGCVSLDGDVDIADHLEQSRVIGAAFTNIRGGIHDQVVAVIQGGRTGGQSRTCASLVRISQFGDRVSQRRVGAVVTQHLAHRGSVIAAGKEAAIGCVSLQSGQECIRVNTAAPLDIGQHVAFLTPGEDLVRSEGMIFQNAVAGHGDGCCHRRYCQHQSQGQGQHQAGDLLKILHGFNSFLFLSALSFL